MQPKCIQNVSKYGKSDGWMYSKCSRNVVNISSQNVIKMSRNVKKYDDVMYSKCIMNYQEVYQDKRRQNVIKMQPMSCKKAIFDAPKC